MNIKHWQRITIQSVVRATAGLAFILGLAANAASAADKAPAEPSRSPESQRVKPGEVPQGLDPQSWDSIQAQIDAARYDFSTEGAGISGANPEQRWELQFDSSGVSVGRFKPKAEPTSDSPPAHVGSAREQHAGLTRPTGDALRLRTTAIGRAQAMQSVDPAAPAARNNRIELHHSQATEWYVNTAAGLEHGYTFDTAPPGARGEVRIQLAVDGGLKAHKAESSADGVRFTDASGAQRIRYHKLLVQDADGRALQARLEVEDPSRLLIAFDDTGASYPVTVDPLLVNEEAKLTVAGDGSAAAELGWSVAVDGDTMVAGRPLFDPSPGQGSAYVFVRSGSAWVQQAKLGASDAASGDAFGYSVAVSGDTAVIGALSDIPPNSIQGSAYVFVRTGSTWTQQAKLIASDGGEGDFFGWSVAVSGNTAVVGAPEDDNPNDKQGSAYVFVRTGSAWTQQAKLGASDGAANDLFGNSVGVFGDTAVVGAPGGGTGPAFDQGSAYAFLRTGTAWTQQAKLTASDGATGDLFAFSVAISGDTAVIGARGDSGPNNFQGSAYVFVRTDGAWAQQAKLSASDGAFQDAFGWSVALSGNTAVVGARNDSNPSFIQGSAYVFVRTDEVWTQQTKLSASDGAFEDRFGQSVAVSGDTAVVGAPYDDDINANSGAAYVFVRSDSAWSQQAKLTSSDGADSDFLGWSVALSGDTALVGAYSDDIGPNNTQGSAYVFVRSAGVWSQQARLIASDGAAGDLFGFVVALSGDTAVVGAHEDDNPGNKQGSAYVFVRSGTLWTQQAKLSSSDGAAEDQFGRSVAVSGNTAVIGAFLDDTSPLTDHGSAYVFVRSGTLWTQQAKLTANDGAAGDLFGASAAASGDTVVVGAWGDDNPNNRQGSAYAFVRSGTVWTQQAKLSASDGTADDFFGFSVALSGDTAVIGAYGDEGFRGSAYVFVRSGTWTQQAKLNASDGATGDLFGFSVAVSGDLAVIGAVQDDNPGNQQGSASIFVRSGSTWTQQPKLGASDGAFGEFFGWSVAVSGDTALIGKPFDDNPGGGNAGAAYVYRLGLDYGDAPDPTYPTLLFSDGARHLLNGPRLGTTIDAELDGQPNSGATGDDIATGDDEDGVSFGTLTAGQSASVNVFTTAPTGAALLDAWIDFNRDGDWADSGEQIFNELIVVNGANNGLSFPVPATAVAGMSYARLRLSSDGVASFTGAAPDGEVEDYIVTIQAASAGTVQLSDATYSVSEAGPTASITLTRSGGSTGAASVQLATSNGTATAGSDYTASTQTVNWASGDMANKTVSIAISNDTTDEPNETVNLTLSGASGATLGTPSSGVLTITDNDDPPAGTTIGINDVSASEGNSGSTSFRFMVRLSAAASIPVSVSYATADGSATVAGSDYNARTGTVSFAVGELAKTVTIGVRGDTTVEPTETFVVNLSGPSGATIADGSGTGTIRNDDVAAGLPTLRVNDVSVSEGPRGQTKTAKFTVSLSRTSTQTVIVNYATANGTAVAPGDYTSRNGTLSFAPGATSRTLSVTVKGDSTREPNETFKLNLSNSANATIADGQGIGTIRNDD